MKPHAARDALAARDLWEGRRRRFDDDETGIAATEETLERVIELAGSTDLACDLVFECERSYWQSRNAAARVQKATAGSAGAGVGQPRPSHLSLLAAFLPANHGHVHAFGL